MTYLLIILVSALIAYFLKVFDVKIYFEEQLDAHISFLPALGLLNYITKNQVKFCVKDLRQRNMKELKHHLSFYFLHFEMLVKIYLAKLDKETKKKR